MDNNILTVSVRNKMPSVTYGDFLVADNAGYKLRFDFDDEWNDTALKTARFQIDGWTCDAAITGDTVRVPLLPSNVSSISVGVYAGELRTSAPAIIPVYESIRSGEQGVSTVEAAEIDRVNSEAERVAAEEARVEAESARVAAELLRSQHEAARVSAENARISAEIDRIGAESARANAESARAAAEFLRRSAESSRVSAENARSSAESSRESAEQIRRSNETARISAENTRSENETSRTQNEGARIQAENARSAAETVRQTAESARQTAESARQTAENARVAAEAERSRVEEAIGMEENLRSLAEAERVSAETARANAESARASAEAARVSAEQGRVSSESARADAELLRTASEERRSLAERAMNETEAQRQLSEQARQAAETDRASAESARQTAETARQTAELSREEVTRQTVASLNDYMTRYDFFDVLALIREYGFKAAFRSFILANAPVIGLDAAVLRFFTAASACSTETYISEFYNYASSPSPIGTKLRANAGLVCTPSTNSSAGRDDYADLPLFACFDCNYTIDATTLEPVIHAIKGVYGEFSSAPASSLVGVLQMTGWIRRTADATTKLVEYAASEAGAGFKPLPEAVRASDNSVRPFVIHAKYTAGYNSLGRLSSVSGVQPATGRPASGGSSSISREGQVALYRQWGNQYSGASICDQAFLQTMLEIKYAVLGSASVMAGCRDYDLAFASAVSETGVKRILLSPENTGLIAGSFVSLGTNSARTSADAYSVCGISKITSIQTVTVDGDDYLAVNIDSSESFDTVAGETYIVSQPWKTGATDAVLGQDGSPFDNGSGKEPFKLQGIEVMLGISELLGDTIFYDSSSFYNAYCNRRAADISTQGNGQNPVLLARLTKPSGSGGNRFINELHWTDNDPERYMLYSELGGTSTTGYCASFNSTSSISGTGYREVRCFGTLDSGSYAGVAHMHAYYLQSISGWTIGTRICGTAGNRGQYSEQAE